MYSNFRIFFFFSTVLPVNTYYPKEIEELLHAHSFGVYLYTPSLSLSALQIQEGLDSAKSLYRYRL